jgi:hypothetical protein
MKNWFCILAIILVSTWGHAQGTIFRYQGQLLDGGNGAQGNYDLQFTLFDASTNGNIIGPANTLANTPVGNGLFTVNLDFGQVFSGTNYWLSVNVRRSGSTNGFTTLFPRQPVTPVPYAIFANTSSNLIGTLSVAQLAGTLPSSLLAGNYLSPVNFTNGANSFNGVYFGNGLNVTNLNASLIATGTVADARLSTNVALLSTNQIFTGSNVFVGGSQFLGSNNTFNGTYSGNGAALTNLNGSQITFGTVLDAHLSTNVPLLNANQVFTGSNTFTGNIYFTGTNTFTNRNNSFVGSFFGNGLVGWIPVSGTSTQAVSDTGYILLNSKLTTVTLPATPNVGDVIRISGAGAGGWKVGLSSGQTILGNFSSYLNSLWLPANAGNATWYAAAASASGQIMYAASLNGSGVGIDISTDFGQTWVATSASVSAWHAIACSADGRRVVAVVYGGSIYYSTNRGSTWTSSGAPNLDWLAVASSANGSNLVAVANNSNIAGIYYSINGGVTWASSLTFNSPDAGAVASSADGTKFVVSINGVIYTSVNSGVSWTTRSGPAATGLASSANGSNLVATVYGGGVYTSTDAGATWTIQTNAPTAEWFSVASSSDGLRLAADVFGGGIYTSADGGVTWTLQPTAPNENWSSILTSADGSKLAALVDNSTAGGIYYSTSSTQSTTSASASASISGPQGSAVELQYIGNNQWIPVSSAGSIWAD